MLRFSLKLALVLAVLIPASARAGVYADDLGKCLVRSASASDQSTLVVWVFSAISSHPDVARYSNISEAQAAALAKQAAALMQRLVTTDCRRESVAALKYEGSGSIRPAFGILGGAAFMGLASEPTVAERMNALGEHFDEAALQAIGEEAGH